MKLVIIAVVVVVLLIGGGGAFYYFNGGFGGAGSNPSAGDQAASGEDPIFLELENLAIPVIRNNRVEKHLQLRITLEMMNDAAYDDVRERIAVVRDAFIKNLADYYAFQTTDEPGVDVNVIKKRLKGAADRAIGSGKIRSVLIQAALERNTTSQ